MRWPFAPRRNHGPDGRQPARVRAEPEPTPDVDNFGIFAGRESRGGATARARPDGEALVHQVRIEAVEADAHAAGGDRRPLAERLLEVVDGWARRCIEQRHAETAEVEALPQSTWA